MSSSSESSPDGSSVIDRLYALQNAAATDVIAARFDSVPLHQVDRSSQQPLQVFGQSQISLQCLQTTRRRKLDQKIHIAAVRIEVGAARGRAERLQPPHP